MKKTVLFILLITAGLSLLVYYLQIDRILTERPLEKSSQIVLSPKSSQVAISLNFPYEMLTTQARKYTPKEFSESGNGPDVKGKVLFVKYTAGTKYSYNVTITPPTVSKGSAKNTIRVSTSVSIKGKGGFRGDGAKILKLDKKNFRASAKAYVDLSFTLDKNWCPVVNVKPAYSWTDKPKVEIVSKAWIDVSDAVEGNLKSQLEKMGREAAKAISCDDIKNEVSKIWKTQSLDMKLADYDPQMYINITPVKAGFSGLITNSKAAQIGLSALSSIEVSNLKIEEAKIPLPPLSSISSDNNGISLTIPLNVPLAQLSTLIKKEIEGQEFEVDTPTGEAIIKVNDIYLYPSGERIAVGLKFEIDMSDRLLDVNGTVYLSGVPVVEENGTVIRLDDVQFTRVLDNELWSVVSVVLSETIKEKLSDTVRYDLSERIEDVKGKLDEILSKTEEKVKINLTNPKLSLGRVGVSGDNIFIEGVFNSKAELTLKQGL
jgi:hypothetical protein